jgi:hypothetical protein
MTRGYWLVAIAAIASAATPFMPRNHAAPPPPVRWPTQFEGRALQPLAPAAEDARLARDFPGRVARFSDGKRQVVLRSVATATRQLHPARDCFHAIGYSIAPLPMRPIATGAFASCFEAKRSGLTLHVCERIIDARGRSFSDVSSWYWPALFDHSTGPWLAATTVERVG